jgi:hypothetical protein
MVVVRFCIDVQPGTAQRQPSRSKTRCRLATFPSRAPQLKRALSSMSSRAYPAVRKSLRPPPSAAHRFPGRLGAGDPLRGLCAGAPISWSRRGRNPPGALCGAPISRSSRGGPSPPASLCGAPVSRSSRRRESPPGSLCGRTDFLVAPRQESSRGPVRRTDFPVVAGGAIPSRLPLRRTDFPVVAGGHPLPPPSAAHRFPGRLGAGESPPGSLCGRTDFLVAPRQGSSRGPVRRTDFPVVAGGHPLPRPSAAHRFPGRAEVVSAATAGRPARPDLLRRG